MNTGKTGEKLLEVRNLDVWLDTPEGRLHAVRDVSFELRQGETLVMVGESGCGKSMTARALMRLLPEERSEVPARSRVLWHGTGGIQDLTRLSEKEMRPWRGGYLSMIFQDPSSFLNPTMPVGEQVEETLILHSRLPKAERKRRVLDMLRTVGIPSPETRLKQYPHELSGGMRQRVMIASALVSLPRVLIADEPTTALDVTTQADIMDLLQSLQERLGLSVLLVTHDLGLASEIGDRIQVMYAGELVETAPKEALFRSPAHPYTWALLRSVPRVGAAGGALYSLPGTPPDLLETVHGQGCSFAPRCDCCMKICASEAPPEFVLPDTPGGEHRVRCWLRHPLAPEVPMPPEIRTAETSKIPQGRSLS